MNSWCCLLLSYIVQLTSAQTIPHGVPNGSINYASNARGMPNSIAMGRGLPNGMPTANNQYARNLPMVTNNMANANFANGQNFANYNLANPYYGNNNLRNIANTNLVNGNLGGVDLANNMVNVAGPNLANPVLANNIAAATIASENLANASLMPNAGTPAIIANVAEFNPYIETGNVANKMTYTSVPNGLNNNVVTFSFGNNGFPIRVSGGVPGNIPVGISIMADKLQVSGAVSVVGRMPIYGAVAINGNVPNGGKASVNYSCGTAAAV